MSENEKGKILILKLYGKIFSILIRDNRILSIQPQDDALKNDNLYALGNIYVGRVQKVSANIGAAFVEIGNKETVFLPLEEAKDAVLTGREPDGTLRAGDELLVQLVKKPVKSKLAGVSARLSITGTYVVIENRRGDSLKPVRMSSKLGEKYRHLYKDAEPLNEISKKFNIIIRTNAKAAEDMSEVLKEAQSLSAKMEHILEIGDKRTCYSCIYQSEPDYITFIKNSYRYEYDEIITDDKEIYDSLLEDDIIKEYKIRFYEDRLLPLHKLYSIETRIHELTDKRVWLKSGAYIIIEKTEALIAIDVNTGKYESRKGQEETYLKINLEAAEAIAAALRARNLSGMILVDFINMEKKENAELLMQHMKELLKKDPVQADVVDITGLGLIEITRKKKDKSLDEQFREWGLKV